LAGDYVLTGGQVTALGPLGDLDGDGIDDGCAYSADRVTFFSIATTLSTSELSALADYEGVLLKLAEAPCIPGGQLAGKADTDGGSSAGADGEAIRECILEYHRCMRSAKASFLIRVADACADLAECLTQAIGFVIGGLLFCSRLRVPVAVLGCAALIIGSGAHRILHCAADYARAVEAAERAYKQDRAKCEADAEAAGCLHLIGHPT
jgi:hypothetical protein